MKKLHLFLITVIIILFASINVLAAQTDVIKLGPENSNFDILVVDFISSEYNEIEQITYINLDTNSKIEFLSHIDELRLFDEKSNIISYPDTVNNPQTDGFIISGNILERQDLNPKREPITKKYYEAGTTLQFTQPGEYAIDVALGFASVQDRKNVIELIMPGINADTTSDTIIISLTIIVTQGEYRGPAEDEVDNSYVENEEVLSYDETMISISNITSIDNTKLQVGVGPTVYCKGNTTIQALCDMDEFAAISATYENGGWNFGEGFLAENVVIVGNRPSAKNGGKIVLTKPGIYGVSAWASDGRHTELTLELVGEPQKVEAKYTSSKVMVDGKQVSFEAYNINDNNYFKLRDIAMAINGTAKNFNVEWDSAKGQINLRSGSAYNAVGGELASGDGKSKQAQTGTSAILKDGENVSLTAYLINNNNYFKLRDLGILFDFNVSWDGANNCILIDTTSPYKA